MFCTDTKLMQELEEKLGFNAVVNACLFILGLMGSSKSGGSVPSLSSLLILLAPPLTSIFL